MAGQQDSDEIVYTLNPKPGIRRDGTLLDSENYQDGQWVRFQRNRPKKMGGFRRITDSLTGPVRKFLLWSRVNINSCISFSASKIENLLVDNNLAGSGVNNRTPTSATDDILLESGFHLLLEDGGHILLESYFVVDNNNLWTVDTQYDDAAGSSGTIIVAHCSKSLSNIDDDQATKPFWALASSTTSVFQVMREAPEVSGGIVCIAPYTFAFGSDGFIAWSDANQPQVWDTSAIPGDAGSDRVTGSKIVAGMPLRAQKPAGMFWALDALIRADYVGGAGVWGFTTLSHETSILSQSSIVEYDGAFFWIGVDRFLYYDSAVHELPNDQNQNWFFDNLNYNQRQKVWATKVPRFGEIWWYFPFGDAEECTHAVIFNMRLKCWYDVELSRSAGAPPQVRQYPVWVGSDTEPLSPHPAFWTRVGTTATVTFADHGLSTDDEIYVTFSSSTAAFAVLAYTITAVSSDVFTFTCTNAGDASGELSYTCAARDVPKYGLYQHEYGKNQIIGDVESAIQSYFTVPDFGYPTGGVSDSPQGLNRWARLTRVEPDFIQTGNMTMKVIGYEFAQSPAEPENEYTFTPTTGKIDTRDQRRHMLLKFESNALDGFYEAGKILIHTEPGDNRS